MLWYSTVSFAMATPASNMAANVGTLRAKVNMLVQKKQLDAPTVAYTASLSGLWRCTVTMRLDGNLHVRTFLAPTKGGAYEGALSKFDLPEVRVASKKIPRGTWKIIASQDKLQIEYICIDGAFHATEINQTSNIFAAMTSLASLQIVGDDDIPELV